jgi:RecA-family ATPase
MTDLRSDFIRQQTEDAATGAAKANGHDAPARLELFDPTTLMGFPVPDREWIVAPWIPLRRATGIYGAPGAGKTLLMQMLCTAAAIGKPWLGLHVRRCKSVLLYCEDDEDEMHYRQEAINHLYGCTYADLGKMRWLPRLGDDNTLMSFENGRGIRTQLFQQVLTEVKGHGALILVVDTLPDVFAGNEIDRSHARQFVQGCLALIARELGGSVIACAHPSLTGINTGSGNSGSTGWPGAFRSHLYLHPPKTDPDQGGDPTGTDERVLTRKKSNWAKAGETIEMRWCDGAFISNQPPAGILGSIERRSCERVFLDLVARLAAQGRYISHHPRTGNYAPKTFAMQPDRERFTKQDFERAMHALFDQKKIKVGSYLGPSRHKHECILPADAD